MDLDFCHGIFVAIFGLDMVNVELHSKKSYLIGLVFSAKSIFVDIFGLDMVNVEMYSKKSYLIALEFSAKSIFVASLAYQVSSHLRNCQNV